jgi:hypothetical protein
MILELHKFYQLRNGSKAETLGWLNELYRKSIFSKVTNENGEEHIVTTDEYGRFYDARMDSDHDFIVEWHEPLRVQIKKFTNVYCRASGAIEVEGYFDSEAIAMNHHGTVGSTYIGTVELNGSKEF